MKIIKIDYLYIVLLLKKNNWIRWLSLTTLTSLTSSLSLIMLIRLATVSSTLMRIGAKILRMLAKFHAT
jgi:hypothetical protein